MKKIIILLLCILFVSCETVEYKAVVVNVNYSEPYTTVVYNAELSPMMHVIPEYWEVTILYNDSIYATIESDTPYSVGDSVIYKTRKFK